MSSSAASGEDGMTRDTPVAEVGTRKVLVSEGVFEALADRIEWGEPDADGFYTPTLYRGKVTEALELGLAWQEAEAAWHGGGYMLSLSKDPLLHVYVAAAAMEQEDGSTSAAALRALAEKLRSQP